MRVMKPQEKRRKRDSAGVYVYPSTQHDAWFTLENSFGETGTWYEGSHCAAVFGFRQKGHNQWPSGSEGDANHPEHAFFRNLPFMQISDEHRKLANFIARHPGRIAISAEDDLNTGKHILTITLDDLPFAVALIAGDFLCCLRSSLDHLAWQRDVIDANRLPPWGSG
jgi:hypothetical protein